MGGLKEHLIVHKSVEFSLEIMLHPPSMYYLITCWFSSICVLLIRSIISVIPQYRCQRGLCRGSPNSPNQHQVSPLSSNASNAESRMVVTYTKNKGPAPQPYNPRALPPPELPPRAISPSTTVSSSWHGGGSQQNQGTNQETSPPRHNDQNAAANPLGRSHSAVMASNIRMYSKYPQMIRTIF